MASSKAWAKIFKDLHIENHDFNREPFYISSKQIKECTSGFSETGEREVRLLCKQDSRKDRPQIFIDNNLFILPVKNGQYAIVQGEGYIDIAQPPNPPVEYESKLDFYLDTAVIGDSEMQHVDAAFAAGIFQHFVNDDNLVLTIRGRKYTPEFSFNVGSQQVKTKSVQTEVDAGYESRDKVVLVEAKSGRLTDTIIRQMFYPYRQWQVSTKKEVLTLFFQRDHKNDLYNVWQFGFKDQNDYGSIYLIKSVSYKLVHKNFSEKPTIIS